MGKKSSDIESRNSTTCDYVVMLRTKHTSVLKHVFDRCGSRLSECTLVFLPKEDEDEEDDDYYEEIGDSKGRKTGVKKSKKRKTGGLRIHKLTEDSHILIKLNLYASNFDEYICTNVVSVSIDLGYMNNALKAIDDSDTITMYIDKADPSVLHIRTFCNDNPDEQWARKKDIMINLTEADVDKLDIPSITPDRKLLMSIDKFKKVCKNVSENSPLIEIISVGNEIKFRGVNECLAFTESLTDNLYKSKKKDKIVQGKYDVKSLIDFSKCGGLCKTIEINLKNNFPLILVIAVGTLGKMYVFIAPLDLELDG